MNFNESLEHNRLNDEFVSARYISDLFHYIKRNNIHQRKDIIRIYKMWFMSGREIAVNGSARGRVVLKHHPELEHLLKIGFIKQYREGHHIKKRHSSKLVRRKNIKYEYSRDTILTLNK